MPLKTLKLSFSGIFFGKDSDLLQKSLNEMKTNRIIQCLCFEMKKMRLSPIQWKSLPDFFLKFEGLNEIILDFDDTELSDNEYSSFLAIYLESLALRPNTITTLGLFLGCNEFNGALAAKLFEAISKLIKLERLALDLVQTKDRPYINNRFGINLIEMIQKLEQLKSVGLNLEGNTFEEKDYETLEFAILEMKKRFNRMENCKVLRRKDVFIKGSQKLKSKYKEPLKRSLSAMEKSEIAWDFMGKVEILENNNKENLNKFWFIKNQESTSQQLQIDLNKRIDINDKILFQNPREIEKPLMKPNNDKNSIDPSIIQNQTNHNKISNKPPQNDIFLNYIKSLKRIPLEIVIKETFFENETDLQEFLSILEEILEDFDTFALTFFAPKINISPNIAFQMLIPYLSNKSCKISVNFGSLFDYIPKIKMSVFNEIHSSEFFNIFKLFQHTSENPLLSDSVNRMSLESIFKFENPLLIGLKLFNEISPVSLNLLQILAKTPEHLHTLLNKPQVLILMKPEHLMEISRNQYGQ